MKTINRGSRWWKFDFHTHTPHSTDTPWHRNIGTADELKPSEWLRKFMEAGLDCVAITDHNGGGWIDRLRSELNSLNQANAEERPNWYRPLTLFPGVEISVNSGIHILAIFAPNETTAKIDDLLARVDYRGAKGDPVSRTNKSCVEVAEIITACGGICIPAHVDEENGILQCDALGDLQQDYQTTLACLKSGNFAALEVVNPAWVAPDVLLDSRLAIARVIGTDCHTFRNANIPGSRFTWIKMGAPSFEGLRLALIDGHPLSVQRSDDTNADPNNEPNLVVEKISVSNLRLMGRPNPVEVGFSPWLTTLIGGRGTGKSTIIDCLRLTLDRVRDLPEQLQDSFKEFNRISADRRDRGAMLDTSEVIVHLRKDAVRFKLTWGFAKDRICIHSRTEDGDWQPADGMIRQRFPIRILSQKEIFEIANQPQSLINLVDSSPDFRLNDWRERRDLLNAQYKRLVGQQRELLATTASKQRLQGELEDITAGISVFEKGANRQTLQDFQITRRQERLLNQRAEEIDEVIGTLERANEAILPSDLDESVFVADQPGHADALQLLRESYTLQKSIVDQITEMVGTLQSFQRKWPDRIERSVWKAETVEVQAAYDQLTQELAAKGVANPTAYAPMIQKRTQLEQQLKDIAAAESEIQRLESEILYVLKQITDHRLELSRRRSEFLAQVLSGNEFVRVKVLTFGSDARKCEQAFREAVGRTDNRMKADVLSEDGKSGLLGKLYAGLPSEIEQRTVELNRRIGDLKTKLISAAKTGQDGELSQWFINHIGNLTADDLDKIRLWFPEDSLEVDYKRGSDWASIEQGSPGQQTAAILAFLLSHGNEPIILDQPEDDLDNHLIYDLIVRQIRESKKNRQIIIATHNPNIVVNGDAEMVIAMHAVNGQCMVNESSSGALQESSVREEVCKVMEGGRDAFLKRYQRIVQPGQIT